MSKNTGKISLSYADIADELGVPKLTLQNFVKWWQRSKDKKAFKPDAWGVSETAPQHVFRRLTAEAIKKAYTEQRILKLWKKAPKKD